MKKLLSDKLGISQNSRALLINAPDDFIALAKFPEMQWQKNITSELDYIHFFCITQKEFNAEFPKLKAHLKPRGVLWVSWPKSKQKQTDLTIQKIIELGYNHGMVESKVISIDTIWSAIKFTHPRDGITYNNSFGKLNTKR